MKLKLIILFLFLPSLIFGQGNSRDDKIDSLFTSLRNANNDVSKFDILLNISREYRYFDIEKSEIYLNKCKGLAQEIDYTYGIHKILNSEATIASISGDYEKSYELLDKAYNYFISQDSLADAVKSLVIFAINNTGQANNDKALEYLNKADSLVNLYHVPEDWLVVQQNKSLIFVRQGSYAKAINMLYSNLDTARKYKLYNREFEILTQLGNCSYYNNQKEETIKYYLLALQKEKEHGLNVDKSTLLSNIGEVYHELGENDLALEYLNQAEILLKKINKRKHLSNNLAVRGVINSEKGDFKKSIILLDEAISIDLELDNQYGLANNYLLLGKIHRRWYSKGNKSSINISIKYLNKGLLIAEKIKDPNIISKYYKSLSQSLSLIQNFQSSELYLNKYYDLRDSIITNNSLSSLKKTQMNIENELNEEKIKSLEIENKNQSLINLIVIIASIFGTFITVFIYLNYKKNKKYNTQLESEVNKKTKQLESANVRIKRALTREKEVNKIKSNLMLNISHQFRTPLTVISSNIGIIGMKINKDEIEKQLSNIKTAMASVTEIIDSITQYNDADQQEFDLNIEEVNIDYLSQTIFDTLTAKYSLDKEVIKYDNSCKYNLLFTSKKLLEEILFQLLDNSIKFSKEDPLIHYSIIDEIDYIRIDIKDNAKGISDEELKRIFNPFFVGDDNVALTEGTGIGLAIVKRYCDILGYTITVDSKIDEGTTFIIKMPKIQAVD